MTLFYARLAGRIRTGGTRVRICPSRSPRTESWTHSPPSSRPGSTAGPAAAARRSRATHGPTRTRPRPRPRASGRACAAGPTANPNRAGSTRPSSCAAPCATSSTARSTARTEDELAGAARRERAPLAPPVRDARRRDPEPRSRARRRAHFARRLLDDTDLSIADVGYAAGIQQRAPDEPGDEGSVPLHAAGAAGPAPRARSLRRRRRPRAPRPVPRRRSPGTRCSRSSRRARSPASKPSTSTRASTAARSSSSGEPGVIEVWNEPARDALRLRVHLPDFDGLVHLVGGVRRLFDLDADPAVIDAALARDRLLRPLVRARRGLRVPGAIDPFEVGVRAVLGQQVSVAGATRLAGRRRRGARPRRCPASSALGLTHLFPDAATTSTATDLAEIGLPQGAGPRRQRRSRPRSRRATSTLDAGRGLDDTVARAPGAARLRRLDRAVRRDARAAASATRSRPPTSVCAGSSATTRPSGPRRGGRGGRTAPFTCGSRKPRGDENRRCVFPGQTGYSSLRSGRGSGTIRDRLWPGSVRRPLPSAVPKPRGTTSPVAGVCQGARPASPSGRY